MRTANERLAKGEIVKILLSSRTASSARALAVSRQGDGEIPWAGPSLHDRSIIPPYLLALSREKAHQRLTFSVALFKGARQVEKDLANLVWTGASNNPDVLSILPENAHISIDDNAIQVASAIIKPTGTSADQAIIELAAAAMLIARDRMRHDQGNATAQDVVTLLDSVRERFSAGMG